MAETVVLIHTVSPLIQLFDRLGNEILPGFRIIHILDEPLLVGIRQRGGLTSSDAARLWDHIKMVEGIRGQAVLITCTTISSLVDNLRSFTALPVVKIEEAMIDAAIQFGPHLGVLATNQNALDNVKQMLEARAAQTGRVIDCQGLFVPGAFDAFLNRDLETHNRLVLQAVDNLSVHVDGIVLAQASMAMVLEDTPAQEKRVPVFSSPRLALKQVRNLVGNLGWG